MTDYTIIFLSPRRPSRTSPSAMPHPVALVPPAAVAQATGVRGQAASGLLRASYGHLRVRTNPLVLRRRPIVADEPPPAGFNEVQCILCSKSRQGPRLEIRLKGRA